MKRFKLYLCYTLINSFGIIPDLYISINKMFAKSVLNESGEKHE
jgi:hypothetical protein